MEPRVVERTTIRIPVQVEQLAITRQGLITLQRHLQGAVREIEKILLDNPR